MEDHALDRIPSITENNECLFRELAEQSPDMIVLLKNGRILYANMRCEEVLGYSREEMYAPGFTYFEFVSEESQAKAKDAMERFAGNEDLPPAEYVIRKKSGKKLTLLFLARRVHYHGTAVVRGVASDITLKKLMENALRESEQKYRVTLNALAEPVHLVDRDLNMVLANDALKEWVGTLGFRVDGLPRKLADIFPFLKPSVFAEYGRVFETGEPLFTEELTVLGGKEIYTESRKIPVIEDGVVAKVVTAIRDVTEFKRREKEMESLNRELSESNKRLRQIAFTDPLTRLFNQRFLSEAIDHEFQRSLKQKLPFSAVLMDIDYFKSINDVYGYSFGDRVLKNFARLLQSVAGPGDTVIRYSGEEFIILLPRSDRAAAIKLARKLLDTAGVTNFGGAKIAIRLKLSIAAASYPEDGITQPADLIRLAENILVRAKEYGGDRVYSRPDLKEAPAEPSDGVAQPQIKHLKDQIGKLHKSANESLVESIFAFAKTIELKDHYTGEHVERTVYFATRIAEELGLPKDEVTVIKQAAILHDLGKVGISEKILLKPAKLTKKEFTEIKKHPLIGVDIIRPIHQFKHIIPLIMYHHERWDGTGYPMGLKGEEIPVGARVVALADAFQALISNRPYRKAYSKKQAKKIITTVSGSHFDPQVVEAFLRIT
ncbi:MAG: sensor domain-containing diguanylate cyclase/phosphohydrolase [Endomicrobiales bacterium]